MILPPMVSVLSVWSMLYESYVIIQRILTCQGSVAVLLASCLERLDSTKNVPNSVNIKHEQSC